MREKRSSRHFRRKKKFSRNLKVKDAKDTEYLNWRRDQFFIVLIIFSKKKSYEIYGKRREISKLKRSILFLILVIFARKNSYRREKDRFFSSSS